ncbi:Coenzyme PQQ synthesis protein E [Bienertia sinuspersici]
MSNEIELIRQHQPRPKLSNEDRMRIPIWLLDRKVGDILPHGSIKAASMKFNVTTRCISKLWNKAKRQNRAMQSYNMDKNFQNCGRKRIELQPNQIEQLAMEQRTCIKDLATMLHISPSTVWRMIKRGLIKPHTNALHPGLPDHNKKARME